MHLSYFLVAHLEVPPITLRAPRIRRIAKYKSTGNCLLIDKQCTYCRFHNISHAYKYNKWGRTSSLLLKMRTLTTKQAPLSSTSKLRLCPI